MKLLFENWRKFINEEELQEGWKEMMLGGAMAIASILPTSQARAVETAQRINNLPREQATVVVSDLAEFYQETYSLNDRIRAADLLGRMRDKNKSFIDQIIINAGFDPSEVKNLLSLVKNIKISGDKFYIKLGVKFKRDNDETTT